MATGIQAYLEITPAELEKIANRLGFPWIPMNQAELLAADNGRQAGDAYYGWIEQNYSQPFQPELNATSLALIQSEWDPDAGLNNRSRPDLIQAQTPAGPRGFFPMQLSLVGNSDPDFEEWPDYFFVGISVATRYHPAWIDWRQPHGVYDVPLGREPLAMLEKARISLRKIIPELEDLYLHITIEEF